MTIRPPHDQLTDNAGYFEQAAEKLVLEGYRCWIQGYMAQSVQPWGDARLLYCGLLGEQGGMRGIAGLARFVKTLSLCSVQPLQACTSGSRFLCRDEVLVMGLIAGIQNCDEPTVHLCLRMLCCPGLVEDAAMAAGEYALTLKCAGKVMQPIPAHVIAATVRWSPAAGSDPADRPTLQ